MPITANKGTRSSALARPTSGDDVVKLARLARVANATGLDDVAELAAQPLAQVFGQEPLSIADKDV